MSRYMNSFLPSHGSSTPEHEMDAFAPPHFGCKILAKLPVFASNPGHGDGLRPLKEDLTGKTIAVVGIGASGRAAARLALVRGASKVVGFDRNDQLPKLECDSLFGEQGNVDTVLGRFDEKLLWDADRVVVSPGVPLESHGLLELLQSGRNVMSEIDFAAEVLPERTRVLAVTGTNGKSTVSTFARQMLHSLGFKVFVGGNLGIPLSEAAIKCLDLSLEYDIPEVAVVEISSYQLEIQPKYLCPTVALVLNLTPDHLERHKTMWNYASTKCRIFSQMRGSKIAVIPAGNAYIEGAFVEYGSKCNVAHIGDLPGLKMEFEMSAANLRLPSTGVDVKLHLTELNTVGSHNQQNAAVAAFAVLGLNLGTNADAITATFSELQPPPHRMQFFYQDSNGVTWVDDSKATNVESSYAGIAGLRGQKSVILLGGLAKVSTSGTINCFMKLVEPLQHHRGVVTFGASAVGIQKALQDGGLSIPCIATENLGRAVDIARTIAANGDLIVLCPGCASFDEFRNFEHRGKVFQELAFNTS